MRRVQKLGERKSVQGVDKPFHINAGKGATVRHNGGRPTWVQS